jgi:hypothetical protein
MSEEGERRSLAAFAKWQPPAGAEFNGFYGCTDGRGASRSSRPTCCYAGAYDRAAGAVLRFTGPATPLTTLSRGTHRRFAV